MRGETYLWAYWLGDPDKQGRPQKWLRGWKSNTPEGRAELHEEVRRVWQGNIEVAELQTRDRNYARSILDDKMSQMAGDLTIAQRRYRHQIPINPGGAQW